MNSVALHLTAHKTCTQCKSAKKKCDKALPVCSRCTRLSVPCLYPDADTSHDTEASPGQSGTRIEEILERLSNIESHIGLSNSDTNPNSTPSGLTQSLASSKRAIPDDWKISPGNLHPDSLGMVTYGSLVRVQREKNTPLATFINKYFSYTHFWLPMVRRRKLDTEFENLDTLIIEGNDDYKIVFLAMHLLVSDKLPGDTSSSYDYRACKYHFGHYLTLKKPYVHLIQAGMMIALYEHMQSIEDRAITTLGICARLAYTLNLDRLVAEISYRAKADLSAEEEEAVLTWWGLSLLDRYFSMNPAKVPHHPCIPLFDDGGEHVATNSAGIPTTAFHTVDKETIEGVSIELVSASLLGRVQSLIRKSLFGKNSNFPESSIRIMRDIDSYLQMLKQKTASEGSWSGHAVCYSAKLHLLCHKVEMYETLDFENTKAIYSCIDEMRDTMRMCRAVNGFTENYLEGCPPTWISIAYQAISTYRKLQPFMRQHGLSEIDLQYVMELLYTLQPRYKLAGA